jgi:DNA recombination protein RmuC
MTRYNETVGSYESSVLVAARRFDDLGVSETPVPTPPPVEATIRTLRPAELPLLEERPNGVDADRDGTTG